MKEYLENKVIRTGKGSVMAGNKNKDAGDFTRRALQNLGFMTTSSELNLVLTAGATSARSIAPVTGETRFNTTTGTIETYNGTAWTSVNGYTEYTTTLSNTNLKNLRATPITVLAAAGTGFYWDVLETRITYTYATTAFTNTNVTDLKIYDATTTQSLSLLDSGIFTRVATTYGKFENYKTYMVAPNSLIKVSVTGSAELLAGGGTATVTVVAKKRAV